MKKPAAIILLATLMTALLSCAAPPATIQTSAPITVFHFFEKEGSGPPGAFWKVENLQQIMAANY